MSSIADLIADLAAEALAQVETPWRQRAACRHMETEVFYPREPDFVPAEVAAVCSGCEVREPCLEWALEAEDFGIWAGLSEEQRRRIRKSRLSKTRRPEVESGILRARASRPDLPFELPNDDEEEDAWAWMK